ncbi:hypothetical protein H2248_005752 [Termitomyces sp. 'cryptogamus']|nr:hypothetical protein H2248_005752 [Termitomyces sp. 'cryptogamus']
MYVSGKKNDKYSTSLVRGHPKPSAAGCLDMLGSDMHREHGVCSEEREINYYTLCSIYVTYPDSAGAEVGMEIQCKDAERSFIFTGADLDQPPQVWARNNANVNFREDDKHGTIKG